MTEWLIMIGFGVGGMIFISKMMQTVTNSIATVL